jgi:membrane protein DedA with SNARE-associated domain
MNDLISDFTDWMTMIPAVWAYLVILGIAYGENVIPPIPGDLLIVFGGYLAGIGKLSLPVVILLSTAGGALGFMTMYAFGRRVGDAVFDPHRLRWLPKKQIFKAKAWLGRWGYGVVLANRFLSGARSVISLTVGMVQMDAWKTALLCTVSALVWTGLITYGGYAVGANWEVVVGYLETYGRIVLAVLGLIVLIQVGRYLWKKKQAPATSEDEPATG